MVLNGVGVSVVIAVTLVIDRTLVRSSSRVRGCWACISLMRPPLDIWLEKEALRELPEVAPAYSSRMGSYK